jgi:hypothetical protein
MGSELVSFVPEPVPLLDGERGVLAGARADEGLRDVTDGADGAIVSCSAMNSFASIVAATFRSSDPPHAEQNRPFEEACAPQKEQYMGGGDSIISGRLAVTFRGALDEKL